MKKTKLFLGVMVALTLTRGAMSLRRSYVKTVGVQIAPVDFSIGAIFTPTVFTKFLLGLIASQFRYH